MRTAGLGTLGLALATLVACQAYNMEGVEPQTLVAVETSGDFNVGKPPALLILQDRSGSMTTCFPSGTPGGGNECQSGSGTTAGDSRMHVAQRVMSGVVESHADEVLFGLSIYGVGGMCGEPLEIAAPAVGSDAADRIRSAYANHDDIRTPMGGTPTTRALEAAYETLVDGETGAPKLQGRDSYVVLVTDGLMNCNEEHAVPCVCASEGGCSGGVDYGDTGDVNAVECLDDAGSIAAVERLAAAGVKTFVIGLGFGDASIAADTLNALAVAGGVPRDGDEKFYSAADEDGLQAALDDIVSAIVVPCRYELDGPVCDGRLVSIDMTVDGEKVATRCDPELEGDSWHFVQADGGLDPRRITFSPELCARFAEATTVKISIRGVENGCGFDDDGAPIGPACDLSAED